MRWLAEDHACLLSQVRLRARALAATDKLRIVTVASPAFFCKCYGEGHLGYLVSFRCLGSLVELFHVSIPSTAKFFVAISREVASAGDNDQSDVLGSFVPWRLRGELQSARRARADVLRRRKSASLALNARTSSVGSDDSVNVVST